MGENNVKEIKCESIEDFIKKISYKGELYGLVKGKYIFRGESSDEYELIPSALRKQNHESLVNVVKRYFEYDDNLKENSEYFQMVAEYINLHNFYMLCDYRGLHVPSVNDFREKLIGNVNIYSILKPYFTWLPLKYIEIAGLAQHYGVYTRLLDWSRDINVAIYFAVSGLMNIEKSKMPKNIVLWVLDATNFNAQKLDCPGIELYTPEYAGNPNLCAQKGVFSLYRVNCYFGDHRPDSFIKDDKNIKSLDEIIKELDKVKNPKQAKQNNEGPILYKILIPTPKDDELYNYLRNEGYDASLIFPGYEGAAKTIKEDTYWKNLKRKNEQESK